SARDVVGGKPSVAEADEDSVTAREQDSNRTGALRSRVDDPTRCPGRPIQRARFGFAIVARGRGDEDVPSQRQPSYVADCWRGEHRIERPVDQHVREPAAVDASHRRERSTDVPTPGTIRDDRVHRAAGDLGTDALHLAVLRGDDDPGAGPIRDPAELTADIDGSSDTNHRLDPA